MARPTTRSCEFLSSMRGTLSRVKEQMAELGMSVSIWDADAANIEEFDGGCGFCRRVRGVEAPCRSQAQGLVRRVLDGSEPVSTRLSCGCVGIAVPIFQRRRLAGVAVAGFPVVEMIGEGHVERLRNGLGLDGKEHERLLAACRRRRASEDKDFLHVLDWLLNHGQAVATAERELTNLSVNLSTTYEELSLLYSISGSMKVTQRPEQFLQSVCDEVQEVMNVSAVCAIVYAHPPAVEKEIITVGGTLDLNPQQIKLLSATELEPGLRASGRAMVNNHFSPPAASGLGNAIRNVVAAPLSADERPIGMLIGFNRLSGDFDSADMKLMSSIASQAAVFLNNHRLYADLQDLLIGVLHALTSSIDAKDPYTCGHSQRVAAISRRLAEECGFPPEQVQRVYLSGLLHDIGKIGVPEDILRKPGRLTDEEYEQIKQHPARGAKILEGIRQLDFVIPGVLCHHERPDGRGYPDGLTHEQLPLEGLIVGLADCFDAMTSDRTYRKALPLEVVTEEIRKYAGAQFDETLVEKFLSIDLPAFMEELRRPMRMSVSGALLESWK